jgi:septal ring factor EnvC (AmiA/AmiB activator)
MTEKVSRLRPVPVRLFFIVLIFAAIPVLAAQATAGDPSEKVIRGDIGKLSQGIERHRDKIRQSENKETTVLDELEQIDGKLEQQRKKIRELQQKLQARVKLLAQKELDLNLAVIARDTVLLHLQKRLRALYQMGKTGILNVSFSHMNLPELMLFNDSFKQLISYDQSVIDTYRDTVTELERAKHAQELEKALLKDFIRRAEDEKKALHTLRLDKESVLARIKTQKSLYKLALQEMHNAETDLEQTLTRIKHKKELKKQGFRLNKGKLPPPVKGTLVLKFGEIIKDGLEKGKKTKGITVATAGDTAVHAIYKGKVVFAGYKRGLGNMVVIDHGYNYFTVTSRLDSIVVQKGDKVKKRALIGSTGDMATLFTRGLYFEIRRGSTRMDPLKWLKSGVYAAR